MIKKAWYWMDTYRGSLLKSILLILCALLWIGFMFWFSDLSALKWKQGEYMWSLAQDMLTLLSAPIIFACVGFSYVHFINYRTWRDIHAGKITDYRQLLSSNDRRWFIWI